MSANYKAYHNLSQCFKKQRREAFLSQSAFHLKMVTFHHSLFTISLGNNSACRPRLAVAQVGTLQKQKFSEAFLCTISASICCLLYFASKKNHMSGRNWDFAELSSSIWSNKKQKLCCFVLLAWNNWLRTTKNTRSKKVSFNTSKPLSSWRAVRCWQFLSWSRRVRLLIKK